MSSKKVHGLEPVIAALGEISGLTRAGRLEFSFREFTIVEKLAYAANDFECRSYDLELTMRSGQDQSGHRIGFKFEKVSSLKAGSWGGALNQIMGLYVEDISSNGWEDINWEVGDDEDSRVSFWCKRISVIHFEAL